MHSVFELNNTAYMVMRFEEGENLAALLERRGTLPEAELLRDPAADPGRARAGPRQRASSTATSSRTTSTSATDGSPVLLDFGSARHALGNSNTLTILVAPGYAPFEQYYSDADSQGPWTDIYGLGATCYRAIAGTAAARRDHAQQGHPRQHARGAGARSDDRQRAVFGAASRSDRPRARVCRKGPSAVHRRVATRTGRRGGCCPDSPSRSHMAPGVGRAGFDAGDDGEQRPPSDRPADVGIGRSGDGTPSTGRACECGGARAPSWRVLSTGCDGSPAVTDRGHRLWGLRAPADDARAKIAMLEQKLQEQERADVERALAQKARADEQASAREAAARADDERRQTDVARKREADAQLALAEQRAREAERLRQVGTVGKATEGVRAAVRPVPVPAVSPEPLPGKAAPSVPPKEDAVRAELAPAAAEPAKVQPVAVETPPTPAPAPDPRATAERAARAATPAEAVAALRPLAEAGNPSAQEILADHLAAGRGVARDATAAALWYEKAALRGNTDAQFKLAGMYGSGQGVAQNNNLAYIWYGTAARLGHEGAQAALDKTGLLLQPAERQQAGRVIESMLVRIRRSP